MVGGDFRVLITYYSTTREVKRTKVQNKERNRLGEKTFDPIFV